MKRSLSLWPVRRPSFISDSSVARSTVGFRPRRRNLRLRRVLRAAPCRKLKQGDELELEEESLGWVGLVVDVVLVQGRTRSLSFCISLSLSLCLFSLSHSSFLSEICEFCFGCGCLFLCSGIRETLGWEISKRAYHLSQ